MKQFSFLAAIVAACLLCATSFAHENVRPKAASARPLNVAVLLYDDMNMLDATGPLEVFATANNIAPRTYNVFTVARRRAPIAVDGGAVKLQPQYAMASSPSPDILVVPGASVRTLNALENDAAFISWIARRAKTSRLTMSVCTGAFLLGKTGALDGRRATTHWFTTEMFQSQFPKIKAMQGARFVEDGKFISTAGVSSGLDGALYVVEKTAGKSVADVTARALQYRRDTPPFPAVPRGRVIVRSAQAAHGKTASQFDVVCGMKVGDKPHYTAAHGGETYGFCSPVCRDKFLAHPEQYAKSSRAASPAKTSHKMP